MIMKYADKNVQKKTFLIDNLKQKPQVGGSESLAIPIQHRHKIFTSHG